MRHAHSHHANPIEISPATALTTLQASLDRALALPHAEQTEQLDPLMVDRMKERFVTGDLRILARADEDLLNAMREARNGLAEKLGANPITGVNAAGGFETSLLQMNRALGELGGDAFAHTEGQRLPPLTSSEAKSLMTIDHHDRAHLVHSIHPISGSPGEVSAVHRAMDTGRCYYDSTHDQILGHGVLVISDEMTAWVRTKPYPKFPA